MATNWSGSSRHHLIVCSPLLWICSCLCVQQDTIKLCQHVRHGSQFIQFESGVWKLKGKKTGFTKSITPTQAQIFASMMPLTIEFLFVEVNPFTLFTQRNTNYTTCCIMMEMFLPPNMFIYPMKPIWTYTPSSYFLMGTARRRWSKATWMWNWKFCSFPFIN